MEMLTTRTAYLSSCMFLGAVGRYPRWVPEESMWPSPVRSPGLGAKPNSASCFGPDHRSNFASRCSILRSHRPQAVRPRNDGPPFPPRPPAGPDSSLHARRQARRRAGGRAVRAPRPAARGRPCRPCPAGSRRTSPRTRGRWPCPSARPGRRAALVPFERTHSTGFRPTPNDGGHCGVGRLNAGKWPDRASG
jgi:hypothetical protein